MPAGRGVGRAVPGEQNNRCPVCVAFRVLSRLMCLVGKRIAKNKACPFKTFLLLMDVEIKHIILAERCHWDPWTKGFCEHFADAGIDSVEALQELHFRR